LYRAKADLSDIQQKLADAKRQQSDTAMYFNFLLNRPLNEDIALDPDSVIADIAIPPIDIIMRTGVDSRDELTQMAMGIQAASNNIKLNNSAFVPNVAVAVDYGFQGDNYHFTSRDDVTMVSLIAQWNIFNGGQDCSRRRQAVLDANRLKLQKDELRRQIELQIRQAYDALIVAQQGQETSIDRLQSAKKSFDLASRRYSEGLASQVEYLDARTNYTASGINQILTTYDFVQKYVQLERAAALYDFSSELIDHNNKGE
jgi:outer membrane protein TolC